MAVDDESFIYPTERIPDTVIRDYDEEETAGLPVVSRSLNCRHNWSARLGLTGLDCQNQ